ncbi:MAG: hypothetical protein JWP03_568 [Phycisphaerales bacterium]|nr:hypothetical protein [Phycisphaerales bacterium]
MSHLFLMGRAWDMICRGEDLWGQWFKWRSRQWMGGISTNAKTGHFGIFVMLPVCRGRAGGGGLALGFRPLAALAGGQVLAACRGGGVAIGEFGGVDREPSPIPRRV